MPRPLILVTNDDGVASPGLAAAVAALDPLGELLIVAPATQQTSMGRSRSQAGSLDGRLERVRVTFGDREWPAVAANAVPAIVVEHAVRELATRPIDLAVSGINYGENLGTCVTVSGTIGAALEAAERGIKALAVSVETDVARYFEHDNTLDFAACVHFVRLFAARALALAWPRDVDVLKIDIPASATPQTGWRVTRQDRLSYYTPQAPARSDPFTGTGHLPDIVAKGLFNLEGSDAQAIAQGLVSVTPLSLDLTSRVDLRELNSLLG
jgi:5'-nucleotidase